MLENAITHEPEEQEMSTAQVLDWVFHQSAAASSALADRTHGRVLEIAQIFGNAVVDMKQVPVDRPVRLGLDFEVPMELIPGAAHTLFRHDGMEWICTLDPRWAGFVETGGERLSVRDLVAFGRAEKGADGFVRLPVREDERIVIDLGAVLFVAQPVYPSKRVMPIAGDGIDKGALVLTGFMSFVAMVFGIALSFAPAPPKASRMELDTHLVDILRMKDAPVPVQKPEAAASGEKAKGKEGKIERDPTIKERALVKSVHNREVVANAGLLAALRDDALAAMFNQTGLDARITNGLIGLHGPQSAGVGLGLTGLGQGGGGTVDSLGGFGPVGRGPGSDAYSSTSWERPNGKPPGINVTTDGDVIQIGAMDKSLIDKVIKQNMSKIRYCYQRQLARDPSLIGKITEKFVIAKDGSVSTASTKVSTMNNPAVESCINTTFLQLTFPEPKGGGIVIVSYPFLFSPS